MKKIVYKSVDKVKNYIKNNILFLTFVLTTLINAYLLRFFTVSNYFEIKPILGDLIVALVLGAIGYFFKPKGRFNYFVCISIFLDLICIVNSMYYKNYLSYTSFSLIATSLQAIGVTDAIVDTIMSVRDFIYLFQIIILFIVNGSLKRHNYYDNYDKNKSRLTGINTLIVDLIITGIFISTLTSLDISRFNKQWNREYIVMEFGIYIYQFNDLLVSLKPQISPLFGYDENAKMFREYYSETTESETNEYTDILKDKNIIVIHAESIQNFTLDASFNGELVAPNLKRLSEEGLYFSNFYAEESVGTSSDSEFTFSTSLMPANSGTVFVSYYDRQYESIQNLLKDEGYYTFCMHANNGTFWNRIAMYDSLGYDDFYYYNKDYELDEIIGLGLSDKSFFRQSVSKIKDISESHDKFYGTLIMLSNHTPFTNDGEPISDFDVSYHYEIENEDGTVEEVTAPYLEGTKLGNYLKSVHYADEALGEFIDMLDENGLLENTAIIIYGDHDAKVSKSEYVKYYNYDPYTDSILSSDDENYVNVDYYTYELNRKVPFIIWTKDNSISGQVDEVAGMIDALPTLANMLGISPKYALGTDIFNTNNDNVVVFPDGNWLTDVMYYNSQKEETYILKTDTISEDYIDKYNKIAEDRIAISNSIIVYDLIKRTNENDIIKAELQN